MDVRRAGLLSPCRDPSSAAGQTRPVGSPRRKAPRTCNLRRVTRYLIANLSGLLLLLGGAVGGAVCLHQMFGWPGLVLVACVAAVRYGWLLATLIGPTSPAAGGYTYERDAR